MNFTSPRLPGSSAAHETQWPRWPALVTSLLISPHTGAGAWRGGAGGGHGAASQLRPF